MKTHLKLALVAACGVLWGAHLYGQPAAINTNGVSVLQGTNTSTPTPVEISISPEIRAQLLQEAADEIGRPEPNDIANLLARHGAMQTKVLAIQDRQARTGTNAMSRPAPAPVTNPKPTALNGHQSPALDQLDRVIAQLAELRSQLSENRQNQAAR